MVKGARQREWHCHLSTHTHTHWTLPTTISVLETPFDIHVSSVYQTHTCMQAPIPTLCLSAKKTHNKGSRTRPIMSTLMPRSGIPVICSRATLSCDSSYYEDKVGNKFCTSVGSPAGSWLAVGMADLTLDLHTSLSQGSTSLRFHSRRSLSVNVFYGILSRPGPPCPFICILQAALIPEF